MIQSIYDINPNITIIGEYKTTHTKILTRCNVCGFEWEPTPQRLLAGHGCRKCSGIKKHGVIVSHKTHEEFVDEMRVKNNNISITSRYINAVTKVGCQCLICGHKWEAKPANLITGNGCPECGKARMIQKQLKSDDEFLAELKSINNDIEVIGRYRGNKTNILLQCKVCGGIWEAMPVNILRKDGKATGCPMCRRSHGEAYIANWLTNHKIEYIRQKTYDDLCGIGGRRLSYDFFVPSQNALIEYQGEFHDHTARLQDDNGFEIQAEHDRRKREYADANGIKLVEVWYYDDIEDKLNIEFFNNITDPVTTTVA